MTISFMHCKNVNLQTINPGNTISRKHRKEHGRDFVRYHVLQIEPMRQIIESYRKQSDGNFRNALHICRGHFKTFTPDAPLLGRHTGTYWWTPQVRGSHGSGLVLKDYRVNAPSEFGRSYREANENPPEAVQEVASPKDPDRIGRGLVAHNKTLNIVANIVHKLGWLPRLPSPDEPEYDVAWKVKDSIFVCEVKSLSAINEERQLRMAIGQVIRYRQKLSAKGYEPVRAVIAAEHPPSDKSWEELSQSEGILLVWPEVAEERFRAAVGEIAI